MENGTLHYFSSSDDNREFLASRGTATMGPWSYAPVVQPLCADAPTSGDAVLDLDQTGIILRANSTTSPCHVSAIASMSHSGFSSRCEPPPRQQALRIHNRRD